MDREKQLKYQIVKNCEPDFFTPLWESMFFIETLFPELEEKQKISLGKRAVIDLVAKGFVKSYLGNTFDNDDEAELKQPDLDKYLDDKMYWFSDLAPEEKHIELYLTPLGVDVAIGKISFEKIML